MGGGSYGLEAPVRKSRNCWRERAAFPPDEGPRPCSSRQRLAPAARLVTLSVGGW